MAPDSANRRNGSEPIRVLIAESTPMNAELLGDALSKFQRLKVIRSVARSNEALGAAAEHNPHVAVISDNLESDPLKGFSTAAQLQALRSGVKAVLLLDSSKPDLVVRAFRAGAKGVFCRDEPLKDLCKCIQSVHRGNVWASSAEVGFVLEALREVPFLQSVDHNGHAPLSRREEAVVVCVAQGLTNREIAARLTLSEHTVKNYLFRVFDKLGLSNRVEVVLYALRHLHDQLNGAS